MFNTVYKTFIQQDLENIKKSPKYFNEKPGGLKLCEK